MNIIPNIPQTLQDRAQKISNNLAENMTAEIEQQIRSEIREIREKNELCMNAIKCLIGVMYLNMLIGTDPMIIFYLYCLTALVSLPIDGYGLIVRRHMLTQLK